MSMVHTEPVHLSQTKPGFGMPTKSTSSSWVPKKVKHIVTKIGSGKTPSGGAEVYSREGIPFIRSQNVYDDGLRFDDVVFITDDIDEELAASRTRPNDVLLNITGASIGRCTVVPESLSRANVNQHVCILRPSVQRVLPQFLHAVMCSETVRSQILAGENGSSREGLNFRQVGELQVLVPPLPEQRAIAAWLDDRTKRIDELVAAKRRLVDLLAEQRTALITKAVTKGLNPNAPMKPSTIEHYSDMPSHWRVRPLKYFSNLRAKSFTDGDWIEAPYVTDQGIRLIQCGNVGTGEYIEQGYRFVSEDTFKELACTPIHPGDVLICRMRSSARILAGRACLAPALGARMVTAVDNCIVKCASDVDARYLVYLLSSKAHLEFIEAVARGGTRDRVSRSMLGAVRVPCPPLSEQRAIADHLARACEEYQTLAAKAVEAVEKLIEYRQSLITAAVTGKIDVRKGASA